MVILAIDSGFEKTGYALFRTEKNCQNGGKYIASGLIRTHKSKCIEKRIEEIFCDLKRLIEEFNPKVIILEQLFFFKNQKTAIKVSQTQGAVMLLAAQQNIRLEFLTPLQIKQVVTGYGLSDKTSVHKMIALLLKEDIEMEDDDQSDAIACALAYCCLNRNKVK